MADLEPLVCVRGFVGGGAVGEVGLGAVADEEQVAQRLHLVSLLPVSEQSRHRDVEVLAQQVQQRGLDGGDGVDGHPQVEGLGAASTGVAVGEGAPDVVEDGVIVANATAGDEAAGILERLADGLPAGYLADAGVARRVLQDHQVSGEERAVGPGQVQQHAVVTGDGDDGDVGDCRCLRRRLHDGLSDCHEANHLSPLARGRTTRDTLSPMVRSASMMSRSRCGVSRSTGTEALIASCAGLQ